MYLRGSSFVYPKQLSMSLHLGTTGSAGVQSTHVGYTCTGEKPRSDNSFFFDCTIEPLAAQRHVNARIPLLIVNIIVVPPLIQTSSTTPKAYTALKGSTPKITTSGSDVWRVALCSQMLSCPLNLRDHRRPPRIPTAPTLRSRRRPMRAS